MIDLVLGSTSTLKLNALLKARDTFGWTCKVHVCKTDSGVSNQPVGFAETAKGARNRAMAAKLLHPNALAVGIENGIRLKSGGPSWEDWALIYFITDVGDYMVGSAPVDVPEWAVQERGDGTVGDAIAARHTTPVDDPHRFLTNGARGRLDFLVDALVDGFEILRQSNVY